MLRYFPFPKTFDLRMGTTVLPHDEPFIHVDENYFQEILLKRKLLEADHDYYFQSTAGDEQEQWEVLKAVVDNLSLHYPDTFSVKKEDRNWIFRNEKLSEAIEFVRDDSSTLPCQPLDWIGRHVQEDLLILNEKGELISGQLCFPSGWSLDEKMGKHFMSIHEPLPERLTPMIQAASKLMERIPEGRPIQRVNWGFRICDELDMSTRHASRYRELLKKTEAWTEQDIHDQLFVRIEYQTLHRLLSGKVLFTVHTYLSPISEEVNNRDRAELMLDFLSTVPIDVQDYKLITPFTPRLIKYLQNRLRG